MKHCHLNCKDFYTMYINSSSNENPFKHTSHDVRQSSVWDTLSCRSPFLKLLTEWNSHSNSLNSLQRAAKLHTSPWERETDRWEWRILGRLNAWDGEPHTRGKWQWKLPLSWRTQFLKGKRRLFVCETQSQRLLTNTITTHTPVCLSVCLRLAFHFPECSSSGLPQDQMNTMKHLIRSNVTLNLSFMKQKLLLIFSV